MAEKKLKILVVDNEEIIRAVFNRLLASTPHLLTPAKSGREAVELLKKERFDLIFVDARMRDEAGFSIVERLFGLRDDAVVVIMLSYSSPEIDAELKSVKPFAWLNKPFAIDEVLGLIEKACGGQELSD